MKSTMMDYPLTLPHILERAGRLFGKVEIVSRMPDKSLHRQTYGDFYVRARALAQALQKAGLKPGDRVGTLGWNHYAHHEAYFGIPCAGGVLHTLNLRLAPPDLAFIVNHAGDRFVIVDDVLLPLFEKIKADVKIEKVIVVPLTGQPVPDGYINYEDFIGEDASGFQYPQLAEDDPMGMCYTSGTTGRPKGVVYSHRAIVLHTMASCMPTMLNISQRDTLLPVVPMFHVNAWGLPFTATMGGTKLVLPGPHLDPISLLDLFEKEQVTVTAGVPTIWFGILQALDKNPTGWKLTPNMTMIVGGSAAPESMIRAFDKHNLRVVHAWGMTETTPLGSVSFLKSTMENLSEDEKYAYRATQGIQSAFVDIRGMNEQGEIPWDGKTMGELQVRGPWIAGSYYNPVDPVNNFTKDGWFRTGDVVMIDHEGYIKIADRTKDLIKSGGEWISSLDLENAIMAHPAVAEAAVIAIPHQKWVERPLAVVVLKPDMKATGEELIQFITPNFAKFWLPDDVVFVPSLPKTSTGKFLKSALRDQFKDHPMPEARLQNA
ncbi:MAG TPA: long-chain fatty acid--CoA ligase [Aggregatilineales bacterium]|nr:long-chain fatty acid--CoA ligase [Aggregatilineales bacterium]